MKIMVYLFCIILSARFVSNLYLTSKSKDGLEFIHRFLSVGLDGLVIILFAIIEKGRW